MNYLIEEIDESESVELIPNRKQLFFKNELKLTGYLAECDYKSLYNNPVNSNWACKKCTFINPSNKNNCQMCNAIKQISDELDLPLSNVQPGFLITESQENGPVQFILGTTGIVSCVEENDVIIDCIDTDTCIHYKQRIKANDIRLHEKWYGYSLLNINDMYNIFIKFLYTDFLHQARLFVISISILWNENCGQLSLRHLSVCPDDLVI